MESPDATEAREIITRVAENTSLREGPEAVRRLLEIVASDAGLPLMQVARGIRLPVPVAAAVRRELEKEGLLSRGAGLRLTDKGKAVLESLGGAPPLGAICPDCKGHRYVVSGSLKPLWETVRRYHEAMPTVDVTLDQAFATPETSLRRAVYMWENGDLAGRRLICLGDDDLVSISAGLLVREFAGSSTEAQIVVVDTDERILELICQAAREQRLPIICVNHDLRDPLPAEIQGAFDTAETDPPFTLNGIRLFASRAVDALGGKPGTAIYLSFPHRDPGEMWRLESELSDLGLAIMEIIPDFNEYMGATVLGNRSQIARLQIAGSTKKNKIDGRFDEPIYSKSLEVGATVYKCTSCGAVYSVGPGEKTPTIESLKLVGCPNCGGDKFRRAGRGRPD